MALVDSDEHTLGLVYRHMVDSVTRPEIVSKRKKASWKVGAMCEMENEETARDNLRVTLIFIFAPTIIKAEYTCRGRCAKAPLIRRGYSRGDWAHPQ